MLEQIAQWWNGFLSLFDQIPEDNIAITVYVGGTVIALWAWYLIDRRLPKAIRGISWIIVFALLATPTVSEGNNAQLAPAVIGLIFGVLTKEPRLIWLNAALMCSVAMILFFSTYLWSKFVQHKQNIR